MSHWYKNNTAVTAISLQDRGLQYGDGLFETIAVRDGRPRNWPLHLQRLTQGCELLRLARPDESALLDAVLFALNDSAIDAQYCTVKVLLTAGDGERGYGRGAVSAPNILVGVFPARPVADEHYRNGANVCWCQTTLASFSSVARIKSLNRLEQVLARSELPPEGVFEGLMENANDEVISGTMSNVFFVEDDVIVTPDLTHCGVQGTMRQFVIDTLNDNGIDVKVAAITQAATARMDEAFLSNSQFGVIPIRAIDNHVFDSWPATEKVMRLLADNGVGECRL